MQNLVNDVTQKCHNDRVEFKESELITTQKRGKCMTANEKWMIEYCWKRQCG